MDLRPVSFRAALWFAFLAAFGPVLALNLSHAYSARHEREEENEAAIRRLTATISASIGRNFEGTHQLLVALSFHEPIRHQRPAEAAKILEELRATSPLFANLTLYASDGTLLASAIAPAHSNNISDRVYYQRLQAHRRLALGEYQIGRIVGKAVINLASPLPDQPATGPLACVCAILDLETLQLWLDEFHRAPDTDLVLLDRQGRLLAQSGTHFTSPGERFPGWPATPDLEPFSLQTSAPVQPRVVRFVRIPGTDDGLWVGIGQSRSALGAAASATFWRSLTNTSLIALATIVLVWWISERLVLRPTRRLTHAAASLTKGQWSARADIATGATELRELGRTFDAMAAHLHQQFQQLPPTSAGSAELATTQHQLQEALAAQRTADAALRHSEATARAFLDSIGETALLITPEGQILAANQTSAQRLGRPAGELVGASLQTLLPPAVLARRQEFLQEVCRTRQPLAFDDEREGRMFHTRLTPVLDLSGAVAAIAILGVDITQRHQMEAQLRRSITALEQALAEVKTLSGLLPICANCKKIRDDKGYWSHVEQYLHTHTAAKFSHGICPDCMQLLYPEYTEEPKSPENGTDSGKP